VTHNVREAVCLGDRIILLTGSPGRIREEFHIPLPRPRDQVIGIMLVIVVVGLLADKALFSPWERFLHRRWGTGLKPA